MSRWLAAARADARGEQWKFNISLHVTDAEMRAAITAASRERELLVAAERPPVNTPWTPRLRCDYAASS